MQRSGRCERGPLALRIFAINAASKWRPKRGSEQEDENEEDLAPLPSPVGGEAERERERRAVRRTTRDERNVRRLCSLLNQTTFQQRSEPPHERICCSQPLY
jgi:hypothetical protein